jgi:integrase
VIDACPDAQWKLIFALVRFGGLRCPTEVLSLAWDDVNWEHNRVRAPSPKTERYAGGESRLIPLFPELRPHLLEAAGTQHVITVTAAATRIFEHS